MITICPNLKSLSELEPFLQVLSFTVLKTTSRKTGEEVKKWEPLRGNSLFNFLQGDDELALETLAER